MKLWKSMSIMLTSVTIDKVFPLQFSKRCCSNQKSFEIARRKKLSMHDSWGKGHNVFYTTCGDAISRHLVALLKTL